MQDHAVSSGALEMAGEVEAASQPFVGRWNKLVSTTNWEKGRIICQWRAALEAAGAPVPELSDEAWSQRVGGVTGQHVGRLRRVSERFGESCEKYPGLFWSHFQSALDWDDAEMWLEGAVQSQWSVSQMRQQRWETLRPAGEAAPQAKDIVAAETDEDVSPAHDSQADIRPQYGDVDGASGPTHEGPDFGDEPSGTAGREASANANDFAAENGEPVATVQPFANLGELPDDLAEAFEAFKLAILRHKTDDWQAIARADVLSALDALKELALAPSAEREPF